MRIVSFYVRTGSNNLEKLLNRSRSGRHRPKVMPKKRVEKFGAHRGRTEPVVGCAGGKNRPQAGYLGHSCKSTADSGHYRPGELIGHRGIAGPLLASRTSMGICLHTPLMWTDTTPSDPRDIAAQHYPHTPYRLRHAHTRAMRHGQPARVGRAIAGHAWLHGGRVYPILTRYARFVWEDLPAYRYRFVI